MADAVRWLLARPRSPIPQASFTLEPEAGEAPLTVLLDGGTSTTPEGTAILHYAWDLGDGASAEGQSAEHTYSQPGRYRPALKIATSDDGRIATWSAPINAWCPATPTPPWLAMPLGTPLFPGAARSTAADTFEICAGGKNLGLLAGDDGFFLHQELTGDFRLTLRVESFTSATFGQVGAMVRSNLDPRSPSLALLIETLAARPQGRVYARTRLAQNGVPRAVTGPMLEAPSGWLRLEREGTAVRASSSLDGVNWTPVTELDVPALGDPVLVGVAAATRDFGEPRFEPLAARITGLSLGPLEPPVIEPQYRRGDANADGKDDVSDAIHVLGFLFLGDPEDLSCAKSADSNDDGVVNIADPISFLGHLFLGTPAVPPEPYGTCGQDPTADELVCETYPCS
jgi:regulation of enolase protein 1 (concanavalin A-like superfamily)